MMDDLKEPIEKANQKLTEVKAEIAKTIVGQKRLIDRLLIALLADGHVLVEGVPGIAKTLTVSTLSKCLSLDFKRIQFTPDLLPSDLIGTTIYNPKEGGFFVQKGPIFTNVIVADEINRAPPKVQSALLEVMQEKQVTIAGETLKTKIPFFVMATQNPIEHEGTYPLPEAETDRFIMKVKMTYPEREEEREIILKLTQRKAGEAPIAVLTSEDLVKLRALTHAIYLDEKIIQYILDIVTSTRDPELMQVPITGLLDYGASPRASIALALCSKAHALLEGRSYVTPRDIKEVAFDVLRHRLVLSYEAQAENLDADQIISKIFDAVAAP